MKVSVLVPVYNGETFLAECLESVLSQDFSDFELLIGDNASADSTPDIIARFAKKDSRIVAWRNAENIGAMKNFQLCLQRAQGEHIKFLCADDKLLVPSALGKMSRLLSENSSVSLVSSASHVIDPQSKMIHSRNPLGRDRILEGRRAIIYCWERNGNLIGEPSGAMFRRAQAGKWFHGRCIHLLDWEQWLALLEQGDWAYLAEPLFAFRVHPEQGTNTNRKTGVGLQDALVLMTEYWEKPWLREMASARMLFTQIYYLEKYFGDDARPLTNKMRAVLGNRRYASQWLAHKIRNPVKKMFGI